jgi:hypothetical protein
MVSLELDFKNKNQADLAVDAEEFYVRGNN